jgi:hypothetical protein
MRARSTAIKLTAATTVLLCAATAAGATVRALTLADLVAGSDAIVRGVVEKERTVRDQRLGIVRLLDVRVDEQLAGPPTARVEVMLLGGALEDAATFVPGEADLDVGDEALLFLEADGRDRERFRVTGMAQGAFRVIRAPGVDTAFATRTVGNLRLIGAVGEDRFGFARPCTSSFLSLESLQASIRSLVER